MTRKDYQLIAEAMDAARLSEASPAGPNLTADVLDHALGFLAEALASDNESFDIERFLEAAGYSTNGYDRRTA